MTSYGKLSMGTSGEAIPPAFIFKGFPSNEIYFHPDGWGENIFIRLTEDEYEDYHEELKIDLQ